MPGSSPELNTEIEDAAASSVEEAAAPSTAENDGAPSSMLEVVQAALKGDEETSPGSDDAGSEDTETVSQGADAKSRDDAEAGSDAGEISDEEFKSYAPKTRKRIEQLLDDRRQKTSQIDELSNRLKVFEPVEQIIGSSGLQPAEVQNTIAIAGLIKTNPWEAMRALQPIYEQLSQITGQTLPNDLKEQVRLGYITEPHARSLAQSRNQVQHLTAQQQMQAQREQEQAQQRQLQTLVTDASTAATDWETTKAKTDPDFKLKQPRINELVRLAVHEEGYPKSKADVRALLDRIHTKVSSELSQLRPPRKEVRHINGAASPEARSAPTSILDVVNQTLGR
jgi:hypothetical protein